MFIINKSVISTFIALISLALFGCATQVKDIPTDQIGSRFSFTCATKSASVINRPDASDVWAKNPTTFILTPHSDKQWVQVSMKIGSNLAILGQVRFISKNGIGNDWDHYFFNSIDGTMYVAKFVNSNLAWIFTGIGSANETKFYTECDQ